jgi:hypothetical protein
MLLSDLLGVLAARVDHTRVVKMFQKVDELPSTSLLIHALRRQLLTTRSTLSD